MITLFAKKFQKDLNKEVISSYLEFLKDLRSNSKDEENSPYLSLDFQKSLREIILCPNLDSFSSFKFYWLTLIEKIISIIQLHEEHDESDPKNKDDKKVITEIENDILDFWNSGDLSLEFMEEIKTTPLLSVSKQLLGKLEHQILAFYAFHISQEDTSYEDLNYIGNSEIGDSALGLHLKDYKYYLDLRNEQFSFPFFKIKSLNWNEKKATLLNSNNELVSFNIIDSVHEKTIGNFQLISSSLETENNYSSLLEKINLALSIIEVVSPESMVALKNFTKVIIPINEKAIVSYSLQNLPGISLINMVERNFLDLLDDLTHENGHHFLNTFLNHQDLINEDDDKIYYSPWRKALRPIRGIYHATFTFFWALNLFGKLNKNKNLVEEKGLYAFSDEEKEKIQFRLVEEFYMLRYCMPDLDHAYKEEKITDSGKELIDQMKKLILSYEEDAVAAEALLGSESQDKINSLKKTLEEQRKDSKDLLL